MTPAVFWTLMTFWIPSQPQPMDDFKFSTEAGCQLALHRLGPAAEAFKVRCVPSVAQGRT